MPKRKKMQQKPLDRGFAVTSIPKKAPPEPPRIQDDLDVKGEPASAEVPHVVQIHEPVEDEALIRQRAEERSLQDLVDRLQERTEKEIARTVKVRSGARGATRREKSLRTNPIGHRNRKTIFQHLSIVRPGCERGQ
jgi:ATP-dependent RNA helicase DHX29